MNPKLRVLLRSLLLVILAYAAFAGLVWLFAERLIFLPPRERYARTEEMLLIPGDGGGSIAAVHLRNPHARYTSSSATATARTWATTRIFFPARVTPAFEECRQPAQMADSREDPRSDRQTAPD